MTEAATALTQHQQIAIKISTLKEQILNAHPQMPLLLREIHTTLKNDPAVITLLAPEEVATIVNGLEKQTNTYLAASMVGAKGAKKENLKNVKSADLGFD